MALKLKIIGGAIFIIAAILAFFIEELRRIPATSIVMIVSLIICAGGFYIERRSR